MGIRRLYIIKDMETISNKAMNLSEAEALYDGMPMNHTKVEHLLEIAPQIKQLQAEESGEWILDMQSDGITYVNFDAMTNLKRDNMQNYIKLLELLSTIEVNVDELDAFLTGDNPLKNQLMLFLHQ